MTQVPTTSIPPTTGVDENVTDRARAVTAEGKAQVGEVADVARRQVNDLLGDARHEVRQQTESQAQRLNGAVREIGTQLRGLADGNPSDGPVRMLVRSAADHIDSFSGRFEREGLHGSLASVRDVARRRPFAFLAGAMAAGMVVGRVLRNADTRQIAQDASGNGSNGGPPSSGPPDDGRSAGLGGTPPSVAPRDIEDMIGQPADATRGTASDAPPSPSVPTSPAPAPGGAGPTSSGQP